MLLSSAVAVSAERVEMPPIVVSAVEVQEYNPTNDFMEIAPRHELTRIYWRTTSAGILQFRVWGITSGRWLTEWQNW